MTTRIPIWQVDAFAERPFSGNPAAVCPLDRWLPDDVMLAIAAENNLAETAFFVRRPDGELDLRWFTPKTEVDLCGHATLASGAVILRELEPARTRAVFHTKSGPLVVERSGDGFALDLPARPGLRVPIPDSVVDALGARPSAALRSRDVVVAVFEGAEQVRALVPDLGAVARLDGVGAVSVTAAGMGRDADVDFVSRFFAPSAGVNEDPVTGSAHCMLAPYWAEKLSKEEFRAFQASRRGGEVICRLVGNRVELEGTCVFYLEGEVQI